MSGTIEEDLRLALSDVDAIGLEAVAQTLRAAGAQVMVSTVDVSDAACVECWAQEVASSYGRVDVLVNNAGITGWRPFREQSLDAIDRLMDINVRGVMYGCRAFLPWLERCGSGRIVNISSMIALMAAPMQVNYTTSKWAVRGFSHALRAELAGRVSVTVALPGTVATDLLQRASEREQAAVAQKTLARLGGLMRRFGSSPDYVAARIVAAAEKRRGEVRIGWDSHAVAWLQRGLPGLLPWSLGLAYRQTQRSKAASSEDGR